MAALSHGLKGQLIAARCRSHCSYWMEFSEHHGVQKLVGVASSHEVFAPLNLERFDNRFHEFVLF